METSVTIKQRIYEFNTGSTRGTEILGDGGREERKEGIIYK